MHRLYIHLKDGIRVGPREGKRELTQTWRWFADAVIALEDENALTIEDPDHDERRYKTLGMGPTLNVLFVVHCEQFESRIRIISARKADKKETRAYFQDLNYEWRF